MSAAALARLLPVAPRPAANERLCSWLSRIAGVYGMSTGSLLAHFGLSAKHALTLEKGLSAEDMSLIAARTGLSALAIKEMTYACIAPHAHFMIAARATYLCPTCNAAPEICRKDAALPWTFWCSAHGSRLQAREGPPMETSLPGERSRTP